MKGVTFLLIICQIGILWAAGCSSPMEGPQMVTFKNAKIYQSQSVDSVASLLGTPDIISKGPYTKNRWAGSVQITPTFLTTEWVYINKTDTLILWIEDNYVTRVGIAPTRKIQF